jgi:short-subunit dehydrogenase
MTTAIDKNRFGPWALITGASSGIGREFARQIAGSGINLVLVARRESSLKEVGAECAQNFGIQHRVVVTDLSEDGFIEKIAAATDDLDLGLVVSNAGTPIPGKFLKGDRDAMVTGLRLNTVAHLDIAHYFGQRLARRGKGGLLLVGAMGSQKGVPFMANDSAAKAYVQALAQALHVEFKPLGLYVTLLAPGPTQTPTLAVLGLTPKNMPMKPMSVEQCVQEGLRALAETAR